MFSNRIANSARFLQMPIESQLLYFHMILRADDDGIVESYPIMKLLGVAPDNFKVLSAKGFIRQLNEDQVVLINDWREHNVIRADRKVDSIYLPLLVKQIPDVEVIAPKPRSDVKDNSRRLGGQSTVSISKVRLGKVNKNIPANKLQATTKIYKRLPLEKATVVQRLVYHLEDTLKTNIVNWGKQGRAASLMLKAGYTEDQIKKAITYMATKDDFFQDKGFDLTTVSNSISRYKAQANKNGL